MSEENVDTIKRVLDAYVQGDYETSTAALDPEVEMWADPRAFPDAGPVKGREAVISWFTSFISSFEGYWAGGPDELIDAGEWVIVVLRSGGQGRTSGASVRQVWTVAYKLRGGKIVRMEMHPDVARAMAAIHGASSEETMSQQENVQVVRGIWDAYSRGDFDQIRALSDPDVTMITVEEGSLHGIEAVRRNHERWWEAWESHETTVEEVIGVGDRVFVMARFRGRGRASGVEVEGSHFEVYTVRNRKVVRVEEFMERGEALEAAGLRE
jgi:ketosteroid isomerase-like protein